MAMNLALSLECFKGDRPPHCKKKMLVAQSYLCLLGASFLVDPTGIHLTLELMCGNRGPFPVAAAMVMGVVVGHWLLCLHQHKPYK
jgi:hypothetical protein